MYSCGRLHDDDGSISSKIDKIDHEHFGFANGVIYLPRNFPSQNTHEMLSKCTMHKHVLRKIQTESGKYANAIKMYGLLENLWWNNYEAIVWWL